MLLLLIQLLKQLPKVNQEEDLLKIINEEAAKLFQSNKPTESPNPNILLNLEEPLHGVKDPQKSSSLVKKDRHQSSVKKIMNDQIHPVARSDKVDTIHPSKPPQEASISQTMALNQSYVLPQANLLATPARNALNAGFLQSNPQINEFSESPSTPQAQQVIHNWPNISNGNMMESVCTGEEFLSGNTNPYASQKIPLDSSFNKRKCEESADLSDQGGLQNKKIC